MATKQFQNAKLNVTHLDLKDDASRSVLQSGENISHSLGKIARWYKDIIWTDSKATTEVFGIVKLSDDYKSESTETVPTSKTLNDVVKLIKQTGGWNTTYDFNSNIEGDENLQNGQFKVTEHDLEGDIDHYVSIKGLGSAAFTDSDEYATSGHTHLYAGSDSVGGPATSANKLNTDAGSDVNPIYFSNGIPVACTYSLNKTVPSNAIFTDENVTQTVTTANENFEILFSGTADNTTRTEGTRKNSNLTFNPSTGILTATTFVGELSGNATSATTANKLSNTTAIGSSTKPVYFSADGVPVAIDHSIETSVPSNAVFTDTTYTVSSGDSNGQIKVTPSEGDPYNVSVKGLGSAAYTASSAYAAASHTHNYAGSSSAGGVANSAAKLSDIPTAGIGSETKPVFFSGTTGRPVACTYSLNANVPANAIFTDEKVKQSPVTTDGSFEVLFAGSIGNTEKTEGVGKTTTLTFNPSTGALSATSFTGNGSGLTTLNATNISSGTLAVDRLPGSAVTIGTYGPAAGGTLSHSGTFDVPDFTVDAKGRITGAHTRTFTLPAQYTHPTHTSKASGLYKITVDSLGHVSGTAAVTKSDIPALDYISSTTTRNPNVVLAGPASGTAAAAPTFRALVVADLPSSGATAGSYGPSANATPGYGATFNVPYITVDAKGRVTSIENKTVKIPASDNTNTTYTFATGDTNGTFKVTPSGGTATNIAIKGLGSAAYTASSAYAAASHTHNYAGSSSAGGVANSAAKLSTARTINGVKFDGTADIIVPRSIKHIHYANGTNGTSGYVKICTVGTNAAYGDQPIRITIGQRRISVYDIFIVFENSGSAKATIRDAYFRSNRLAKQTPEVHYYLNSNGYYDIYVKKTESQDHIFIMDYLKSDKDEGDHVELTWTNTLVSTLPSGSVKMSNEMEQYYYNISRTANTVLAAPNGSAGKATFRALVAADLPSSGATAGSYGPSANATPGYGATFNVPYITVDAKGRVTAISTKTVKIPASDNTNTTYSLSGAYGSSSNTWVTTLTPSSGSATTSTVPTGSTSVYGLMKLYNGVDSTSTALAATANAVKTAYDKANHSHPYLPLAGGTMTGDITFTGVSSTTYPALSNQIYFSGSTDWARILYEVTASDDGHLVFETGDDANAKIVFRNKVTSGGTYTRQVTIADGVISGNGSGLTSLNASNISSGTLSADRLATSGATAGSYGPSANATPGYGSTFNVPYITVDAKGRVTAISTKTVKIPASDNTNTTYTFATGDNSGTFKVTPSGGSATNIAIKGISHVAGDSNGLGMAIGAGGLTVLGSGESASALVTAASLGGTNETLYLTSDTTIGFYVNCQTISERKGITLNTSLSLYPNNNNVGSVGTSANKWNTMYATTFYGALSGNAASASKWATARTLTLSGSVTGSVSIDGSGNVTLSTTTNHSHNYAGSSTAGGPATLIAMARVKQDSKVFPGQNRVKFEEYTAGDSYNLPTNAWYHIISMQGADTRYGTQIAIGMTANKRMYFRNYNESSWQAWNEVSIVGHTHSYLSTTTKYALSSSVGGPAYSVEGSEGTDASFRHVWFSTSNTETRRAYSDKFMFEPSSGILKFNSWYPLDITDNTVDLNSYNDGNGKYGYRRYICRSTGGGNKISNKPCDSPFLLEVFLIRFATASSDYITKQVYHAFNKKTYQRFCTNGTWDSWTELKYTDTNTDTKVTQTATTTSAAYEVLFSGTADNTTRTEGARKNSNLTFNPSTGILTTDRLYSARNTGTYLAGNKGSAIINSTASAGAYVMLARMHSTNGYFTHGTYQNSYLLQYTVQSTIDAGTNAVTKSVTLLNESGNSSFPGTVTAATFSGSGASLTSLNASNISSGTLSADRLATSGATAGSYGPSANATPGYGATFNVPYITVDAKGRVTAISTKTVKIPASDNTNTTYTFTTGDNNGTFKVTPSGGTATNIAIKGLGSAAYTASSAYATSGHTHGLGHSNFTVAIDSTTNTWAAIGVDGTNKYVLKSIRTNTNAPPYLLNDFSAGIVFGGEDTRGVISMKYNTPSIRFAGGNRTAADGGTAKWYITLTGTHNTTYNLDTMHQVTQTATTTSAAYEVLFSGTADNTTRTEGARKNSNLTFNPSTGVLTATKFDGQIVGKKYDDYDPFSTKHDHHPVLFYQDSFGSPSKVGYASLGFTYDSIHGELFSGGMNCGVLNTKIIDMSGTTDDPNSEINYKGTKATHTMIKFIDNAGDTSGNGIIIGGGGLVVVGAGESANNLVSAASLPGGQETLYLTSDTTIGFYVNCQTISERKGMTLNTSLHLYPNTNNTGSVGTSSNKWNTMYATTFYGALSGNATTATTAATAKKLKYCTLCNEASDAATYPWYRMAYAYTTGTYSDLNLVMMVTCGFGSKWGIFKARARTEGKAGTFGGTVTIEWIVNNGFTNEQLYLLTKNNYQVDTAKSGTATAEIWFKSDGRYWGYTFTVLHEGWRTGTSSDLWALSSYSKNGSESYNKNASGVKSAASSKVYSTNTPGSSSHAGYSIPFFSGPIDSSSPEKNDTAASGNKTILHNGEFRLGLREGTTSADGYAQLVLGNGIASGTAGNKYGKITLYSSSAYAVQIIPANVTGTRTLTLPNASGTVALTSHTHSYIPTSSAATLFSGTAAASITMTSMSGYTRLVVFCKNTSNSSYFTVELQCVTGYHYHAMTVSPPPAAQTSNSFYGLLFNLSSNTKLSVSAGKYSNLSSSASLANGPTVHITKVLGYKF